MAAATAPHRSPPDNEHGHTRGLTESDLPFVSGELRLKESISGKVKLPKEPSKEPPESHPRKTSEPPPSLMLLFENTNSIASSRRAAMSKQTSADQVTAYHPRQTSLDSSHLQAVQGSPKHGRKAKSSSKSNMKRAPSHPHLNSTTSSPQVTHVGLAPLNQPIHRARSTQQLKLQTDEVAATLKRRSFSGGKEDMHQLSSGRQKSSSPSCSLSSSADATSLRLPSREGTREKDPTAAIRRTPSHESLPDKDRGESVMREKESLGLMAGKELKESQSGSNLPPLTLSREPLERSMSSSKDTSIVAKETVSTTDSLYTSPVTTGRSSPEKSMVDIRRRNSMGIRDTLGVSPGGRKPRPHSMIETSSFRSTVGGYSSEMNTATPDLLAQLFWTAASLLESDFEGEFSMALRLLSKVCIHIAASIATRNPFTPITLGRKGLKCLFAAPAHDGSLALVTAQANTVVAVLCTVGLHVCV